MNTLPPPVATPAPTAPLTCSRCGLADISVVTRDNGVPHHVTPMKCIAALKDALVEAVPPAECHYVIMSDELLSQLQQGPTPPVVLEITSSKGSWLTLAARAFQESGQVTP